MWLVFREINIEKGDQKIANDIMRRCHVCQLGKKKNLVKTVYDRRCLEVVGIDF